MTVYKVEHQINQSSFIQLDHNGAQEFDFKAEKWLESGPKRKLLMTKGSQILNLLTVAHLSKYMV